MLQLEPAAKTACESGGVVLVQDTNRAISAHSDRWTACWNRMLCWNKKGLEERSTDHVRVAEACYVAWPWVRVLREHHRHRTIGRKSTMPTRRQGPVYTVYSSGSTAIICMFPSG